MDALNAHATNRKLYGSYETRAREREGLGDFVPTEAEKDDMKRKRSITPTQHVLDEEDDQCSECEALGEICSDCAMQDDAADVLMGTAGKGPLYRQVELSEEADHPPDAEAPAAEEEGEAVDDLPDLHSYFSQWPQVGDDAVISMCRAYASYLASLSKKKILKQFPGEPTLKKKRANQSVKSAAYKRKYSHLHQTK